MGDTALVALAMALEAPLVSEARSELRLEAAAPVAVASDLLSSDDLEAMSELTDEETEEAAEEMEEEMEDATLLTEEAMALVADEPAEAAEEVAEAMSLVMVLSTELTMLPSVVVSWA